MSDTLSGTSVLTLAAVVSFLFATPPATADERPLHLAMHDMMPMQSNGQSGGSGGSMGGGGMKMDDNMMGMQQNPSQAGGMGGMQSKGSMGQGGATGQMGGTSQQGQGGSMGGGMQSQGGMGRGGSMGQGGMSGQMGGMTNDNMMRMMSDHMRMMGDGMRMRGGMPGMAMGPGMVDMTERFDGRLAFLRTELRITDAQATTWDAFADALRTSRKHLLEARQQLSQAYSSSTDRLEKYEQHLSARLEALKSARTSFAKLHGSLDEAQKRTADELVAPFIATF